MQMILGNQGNTGNEAIGIWIVWMYLVPLSMKSNLEGRTKNAKYTVNLF